jgi:putative serine protease PepD
VLADPRWLHQVITNLLTNALKFTPAGARVTITTRAAAGEAVLQVTDTGPGISAEDLPRAFDRFFRGHQASQISGSGIGLAVAAELAEARRPAGRRQRRPGPGHSDDAQHAFGLASAFLHIAPIAASPCLRGAWLGCDRHTEMEENTVMKTTQRVRRAGLATVAALVIGGSGVAVGTAIAEPAAPAATAARTVPSSTPGNAGPASYAGVVRQVLPSVVLIRTSEGLGSGVVLDNKGNIVTNAHVAGNAKEFQVQVAGDTAPRKAKLVGTYPPDDLAVIRADNPAGLQPAKFGDSDQAQAGDVVLAIGNPLGLSGSVTQGIISATDRAVTEPATDGAAAATLPGAIQTSAPINPGNSGGALVSASGQVIGIPTLAAGSLRGGGQAQGIGFAIPSNLARDIATQIIDTGHVSNSHRAAIGAEVTTVLGADGAAGQGVGVVTVTDGGPAGQAGLKAGDVIVRVGQQPTADTTALSQVLAGAQPGDKVSVTVSRSGQDKTVEITLGELPGS